MNNIAVVISYKNKLVLCVNEMETTQLSAKQKWCRFKILILNIGSAIFRI